MPSFRIIGIEKIAIWLPGSRKTRIGLLRKTIIIISCNLIRGIGISVSRAVKGPADAYNIATENPPRSPNLNGPSRGRKYGVSYI